MTKNTRKSAESDAQVENQKQDEIAEDEETMSQLIGWPTQDDLNPAYAGEKVEDGEAVSMATGVEGETTKPPSQVVRDAQAEDDEKK